MAGAGMAGILTALALARYDLRVLLAEQQQLGGGQSGQSHGYLHQGYAFGPDEPALTALFDRARPQWAALAGDIRPVSAESLLAFANPLALQRAAAYWRSSGLPVTPVDAPSWLNSGLFTCFRSDELTHNFGPIIRSLAQQLRTAGVELAAGRASRIAEDPNGVTSELVDADGNANAVSSRAVVIAAGAGAPEVLARSGLPAVVRCRRSFMLVLRGDLPVISAVFPEREEHGLFIASRTGHESGTTWLVSDYHSFDSLHGVSSQLAGWWTHRVLSTLRRVVRASRLADVTMISGYAATKSSLIPSSGTVAHEFSRDFFGGRAVVTSPSKLTLAPIAAESAVRSICTTLGLPFIDVEWDRISGAPADVDPDAEFVATASEAWETSLDAITDPDLSGELPSIRRLGSLFAH